MQETGDMRLPDRPRVVITGANGLIGRALSAALREDGCEVRGVDVSLPPGDAASHSPILRANLLDAGQTREALEQAKPFSVLIHAAAIAHGQRPPAGETCFSANTAMTRNILDALPEARPRFLFLSSVSVYGEDGRTRPVRVGDDLRPGSEYGRSKLACERMFLESALEQGDILRLAPVFDDTYPINLRRRVFLPGLPGIRILVRPAPRHSLCSLHAVVEKVRELLRHPPAGRRIWNVCDPQPYSQDEIASRFAGLRLPVPVAALQPFYGLTFVLPRGFGYALRCLYWKMFRSNIYSSESSG